MFAPRFEEHGEVPSARSQMGRSAYSTQTPAASLPVQERGSNQQFAFFQISLGCVSYCGQMFPNLLIPQPKLFPDILTLRHLTSISFT